MHLQMVTLVQEPNPRAVLMFLVWMTFLSCTFPHPTSTSEHQPTPYFRVQAHRCPWHLSDFCTGGKGIWHQLLKFAVWIHPSWDICVQTLLLEVAGMDVLTAVSSCSWAPGFCEEKHLSHISLLWKKDNEHSLIWYFKINYCMIIHSNV